MLYCFLGGYPYKVLAQPWSMKHQRWNKGEVKREKGGGRIREVDGKSGLDMPQKCVFAEYRFSSLHRIEGSSADAMQTNTLTTQI